MIVPVLTLVVAGRAVAAGIVCPETDSLGPPIIRSQAIFCGTVDENGRGGGFHSRPEGVNPPGIGPVRGGRMTGLLGLYALEGVGVREGGREATLPFTSMFPDDCGKDEVLAAIRHAAAGALPGRMFRGMSGEGCLAGYRPRYQFAIVGIMDEEGRILEAWPDYP